MDDEQKFIVSESIRDVIRMIDTASVKPDLVAGMMGIQIMNRAALAHLSIERGMKSLIEEATGTFEPHHNLNAHYSELGSCNQEAAQFLAKSFKDAVEFYNINPNADGCGHFRDLGTYLANVGSDPAFQRMRYWELEQSPDDKLIRRFSLTLHSEILRALQQLFHLSKSLMTVTQRVERTVTEEMFYRRIEVLSYEPDSPKKADVESYWQWLNSYSTRRKAMTDAVKRKFDVGNELANDALRNAFNALAQSDDPAVQHFARGLYMALNLLPKQQRDAVPEVKWVGEGDFRCGFVFTPAGRRLGHIEKLADGYWGIRPAMRGLATVKGFASTQTDAACHLADILTKLVTATIDGEKRELRIVTEDDSLLIPQFSLDSVDLHLPQPHDLEFWDASHGILVGQTVRITLPCSPNPAIGTILKGEVTAVDGPKVSVKGKSWIASMTESPGGGDESS